MECPKVTKIDLPHDALMSNLLSEPRHDDANAGPYRDDLGTFLDSVPTGGLDNHNDPEAKINPIEYSNIVAKAYAETIFPDVSLKLLSDKGSSAVILEDEKNNLVFKIRRDATHYSYFEDEMAALTVLHSLGMAPEPYLLLDTALHLRSDEPGRNRKTDFEKFKIVRQEGYGRFPLIVMERVESVPMQHLPAETFTREFQRIAALLLGTGIVLGGDAEPIFDKNTNKIVFLDLGGVEISDKYGQGSMKLWQGKCLERFLGTIGIYLNGDEITTVVDQYGLKGLAEYAWNALEKQH